MFSKILYTIRDLFWNLPDNFAYFLNRSKPFGYILVSILLSVGVFILLTSPTITEKLVRFDSYNEKVIVIEGSIGSVSTFNPIFTTGNQIDRDLHALMYIKLIELGQNGEPEPQIAESWNIDADGTTYIMTISDQYMWSDGESVTIDDVLYTIEKAREINSKLGLDTFAGSLDGVTFSKTSEDQLKIELEDYSSALFENISFYVLPKHVFEEISIKDYYKYGQIVLPVVSGKMVPESISGNKISLVFNDYYDLDTEPTIDGLDYRMFRSKDELMTEVISGNIDSISDTTRIDGDFSEYIPVETELRLLDRKRMLYFNVTNPVLSDVQTRQGLASLIDKSAILEDSGIKGTPVFSPLPSHSWALNSTDHIVEYDPDMATELFREVGYEKQEGVYMHEDGRVLDFTLTYLDSPQVELIAKEIQAQFVAGNITITLKPTNFGSLYNEILATRNYEMLLLEIETNLDPDQYNLWHSTKKNYPDLNISGYEYDRVDLLLERARVSSDQDERLEDYLRFQKYLFEDMPVVVLYEPHYSYISTENLEGLDLKIGHAPEDRFHNIEEWSLD